MGLRTDRSILYIIYWAINLILLLTNNEISDIIFVGRFRSFSSFGVLLKLT